MVGRDRRAAARGDDEMRRAVLALAAEQAGVVARRQLLALGMTPGQVGAVLDSRRWKGLHPGVYATFTGQVGDEARVWAACFAAGHGAAAGGETALWLEKVLAEPPGRITVCVPADRHVTRPAGVRVVRRRQLDELVHPARRPPRVRVEQAVLDVAAERGEGGAVDIVLRAIGEQRTTAAKLRAALRWRRQHRHRELLTGLLTEADEGVRTVLERRYRRDVEKAHGLPQGRRNRPEPVIDESGRRVRTRYRDVRYHRWRLVVELDGDEAHRLWRRRFDRARDNSVGLAEDRHLEYGWFEVVEEPCRVALDVATALRQQGWAGLPTPCGASCPLNRT